MARDRNKARGAEARYRERNRKARALEEQVRYWRKKAEQAEAQVERAHAAGHAAGRAALLAELKGNEAPSASAFIPSVFGPPVDTTGTTSSGTWASSTVNVPPVRVSQDYPLTTGGEYAWPEVYTAPRRLTRAEIIQRAHLTAQWAESGRRSLIAFFMHTGVVRSAVEFAA